MSGGPSWDPTTSERLLPYLSCPSCRFTVSEARTALQNCPRCLLRRNVSVPMVPQPDGPGRCGRTRDELDRITEAKARLKSRVRDAGWA